VMTGGVNEGRAEGETGAPVPVGRIVLLLAPVEEGATTDGTTGVATGSSTYVDEGATGVVDDAASTRALEGAGTTALEELAGAAAALEEAGLVLPPVAGAPEMVPKVRSWGVASVPLAMSSGPGKGYEFSLLWMEKPRPVPVFEYASGNLTPLGTRVPLPVTVSW
jgi:hypothetical protein